VPFTITQPGSYYLTGNVSVGTAASSAIVISASNVTLDLNGFTISSSTPIGAGSGVFIDPPSRAVTVRNGRIQGATVYSAPTFTDGGFLGGVSAGASSNTGILVEDLIVSSIYGTGIDLFAGSNSGTTVRRCAVTVAAGAGILAGTVENSTADTCGTNGIDALRVLSCRGTSVGISITSSGIEGDDLVESSTGNADAGRGIVGGRVSNSTGGSNAGTGISAQNAINCFGFSISGTGLLAATATNCSGTTSTGPAGIDASPGTASYCRGSRGNGGTAISAEIAIGCTVATGTVNSANKFLGTP